MNTNKKMEWPGKVLDYTILIFLILVIVTFALYWNTLKSPFTFDDFYTVLNNNEIKKSDIFIKFNIPRYIGIITFAINYKLSNLNVTAYHLTNLLIHIANALLVYLIIKEISSHVFQQSAKAANQFFSFLITLIFLVHPIQTQAINYISQRYAILSAFFVLASVLFYIKFRKSFPPYYFYLIVSLFCALLAYKTKENTATLPLIIVILEFIFFRNLQTSIKHRILCILPYFILIIVIPLSFMSMMDQSSSDVLTKALASSKETPDISRKQYLITEFSVILTYIRLLFIPINQSIDYYYPLAESFFESRVLLSFVFIIILIAIAVIFSKNYPIVSFGLLWFFIFLLVESSIIPIRDVIFEHRAYLPSIGFIIAFTYALFILFDKLKLKGLRIILAIIIVILSITTYARNEIWKDELSLWKDAVEKYPQNLRTHLNLGAIYTEKFMCDEAIKELEIGLKVDPFNELSRTHLAFCYLKKDRVESAIEVMNYIKRLNEGLFSSYTMELINLSINQQKYEAALKLLLNIYTMDDSNPMINSLLGRIYCIMGNFDKAKFFYDRSLLINDKNADTYYDIAFCLFTQGKTNESRLNFLKSLELNAGYVDAYYFIALTYEMEGNHDQAKFSYQQFILVAPSTNPLYSKVQAKLKEL